ncbi:hypothetical protein AOG2_07170 [Geobacter sp. AOG2]|nr:hypothetical protein AOG2_07170 [Geobacter sp. AOG2]
MTVTNHHGIDQVPVHLQGLLRHFADLRDGTHGNGAVTRADKEQLFAAAVAYLDSYARQTLDEINAALLLGTGSVTASNLVRSPNGDLMATWTLAWPEQEQANAQPVTLQAFYGRDFHHPHLRGGTVGVWPLNVFSDADAEAELPTLRAIASADLHNLVFQRDYRIIPAIAQVSGRGETL